jgi:hypothetical protein
MISTLPIKERILKIETKTNENADVLNIEKHNFWSFLNNEKSQSDPNKLNESDKNILKVNTSEISNEIEFIKTDIAKTEKGIFQLKKDKENAIKDKEFAEDKSDTKKMLNKIIFSCTIALGFFVVIAIFGSPKMGIAGFIGTIVTLTFAITMSQHLLLIAWVGLGIFIVMILLIVGAIILKYYNYKIALKQTVETVEVVKAKIPKELKEEIFGQKSKKGIIGEKIQSKSTQKLIKQEKIKIGKLWTLFKETIKDEEIS